MLAVDKGCRVLWQGYRGGPQQSILGDNLRHHPHCPCTLTPPHRTIAVSHGHPHLSQPGNSHSWLLPPACSWLSGFWLRCSPFLSLATPCPLGPGPAARGAPEMLSLWEGWALFFPAYSVISAPCPVPGAREALGECEVMEELKKDTNIPNLRQEELRTQACQR